MTETTQLHEALSLGGHEASMAATKIFAKVVNERPEHAIAAARMLLAIHQTPAVEPPPVDKPEKVAYKLGEAAALVGVSRSTLREQMYRGDLRAITLGPRTVLVARTELIRWVSTLPAWTP